METSMKTYESNSYGKPMKPNTNFYPIPIPSPKSNSIQLPETPNTTALQYHSHTNMKPNATPANLIIETHHQT